MILRSAELYQHVYLVVASDGGHLRNGLPEYDGLFVFKANEPIIELLLARHALMGRQEVYHSYPHCWRCHRPVIFRATDQWFINMETEMTHADGSVSTFRERALKEIGRVPLLSMEQEKSPSGNATTLRSILPTGP